MVKPKTNQKQKSKDQLIKKDMTIGEIVQKYPASIEVLFEEGIHCVGCMASHFETLEQGLSGHGKEESEINEIVDRMNKAVEDHKNG
ncbi:MAG: DUF1858 domain-containing protein [Candidatus Woesearchaeota archaeon]